MLLERISPLNLKEIELAVRRAVRRRRASISAVGPVGAATVYTIVWPEIYSQLLAAEIRFAALLPLRLAVSEHQGGVELVATSPLAFARALRRPEIEARAAALESLINEILEDATHPVAVAAGSGGHAESALGATEDQMNMRGTVPQRIDSRGSKVEEIAGTGEQDSRGG